MRTALMGLGSNAGDSLAALRGATRGLADRLQGTSVSAVYRTPGHPATGEPDYLNAVVAGVTSASPRELLDLAGDLERAAGRRRSHPGAPRTLDVDLLFLGTEIIDEPGLRVPHPRWASRGFVVVPLLDVAPEWKDPRTGRSIADHAVGAGWSRTSYPRVLPAGGLLDRAVA